MSMSLDGFIAGPNQTLENGLGDGGERLHEWVVSGADPGERGVPALISSGVNGRVVEEFMATGAVVAGRGTFEPADGWRGDHHDGVPIFVLSRHEPAPQFAEMPRVTYLDDVATAMARAKEAAGEKNVLCTAPEPRSSRSPPAPWTRSSSISSRCSSARDAACSTT
jgi:dihydrofolate reductase